MRKPCPEFIDAYNAMGDHFNRFRRTMPESFSFLRMLPVPPMIDHLSFKIGNQIFFIYMDPLDNEVRPVSNLEAMIEFAEEAKAIPCLMPMERTNLGWKPAMPNWGLATYGFRIRIPLEPKHTGHKQHIVIPVLSNIDYCLSYFTLNLCSST